MRRRGGTILAATMGASSIVRASGGSRAKPKCFPAGNSDFFRNRLTHSLEVAQIAQGIAERLNYDHKSRLGGNIDPKLCAAAGLVHDIGHPPFGHNGERALDKAMLRFGGFEGNAQTLRILTRLEKKVRYDKPMGGDDRAGLNLCHRTLASVLKYDKEIPAVRKSSGGLVKGYYASEREIVANIKASILGEHELPADKKFQTLECSIMDLADDIAYSVYDLEDCLKVGILTPAEILASDQSLLAQVGKAVSKQLKQDISIGHIQDVFMEIFTGIVAGGEEATPTPAQDGEVDRETFNQQARDENLLRFAEAYRASKGISEDGYRRTELSSELVHGFISDVELEINPDCIALSKVKLPPELRLRQEVLKQYTYVAAIYAPRVKLGEYRGYDLVTDIFDALMGDRATC